MKNSFKLITRDSIILVALIIAFTILSILELYPILTRYDYPLLPDGAMHHHCIIKIIYQNAIDPSFLKGDLLTDSIRDNYQAPFRSIIEILAAKFGFSLSSIVISFIIISILITLTGMGYLSYVLTKNVFAVAITFCLFLFINSGVFLIDAFINFPRFISQGLCLLSIGFFYERKILISFLLCAISSIFHYGMPFYLMSILFFYIILNYKNYTLHKIIPPFFTFIVIYLLLNQSMVISAIRQTGMPYNFEAWKLIVKETGFFWSYLNITPFNIIYGYIPIIFVMTALKVIKQKSNYLMNFFSSFLLAFFIVQIIHFLVFDVFFVPILVRPVIFNAQYYLPYIIIILLPLIVIELIRQNNDDASVKNFPIPVDAVLFILFFLFVKWHLPTIYANYHKPLLFEIIILILCGIEFIIWPRGFEKLLNNLLIPQINKFKYKRMNFKKCIATPFVIISLGVFFSYYVFNNIAHTSERVAALINDDWYDIQLWTKNNTEKRDVFILPDKFGLFGFRIYAERSTLCSNIFEAHLIAFLNPQYTDKIIEQITSLGQNSFNTSPDFFNETTNLIQFHGNMMEKISEKKLLYIQKKYPSLKYIIVDKMIDTEFPLKHKNASFFLYRIKQQSGTAEKVAEVF